MKKNVMLSWKPFVIQNPLGGAASPEYPEVKVKK
jgi:hypothetical protein